MLQKQNLLHQTRFLFAYKTKLTFLFVVMKKIKFNVSILSRVSSLNQKFEPLYHYSTNIKFLEINM